MKLSLFANISKSFMRVGSKPIAVIVEKSPEILLVSGILGGIVAGVWACRKTYLECENIILDSKDKYDKIDDTWKAVQAGTVKPEVYTPAMHAKDLTAATLQTTGEFIRVYWKPTALAALSIFLVVKGQGILKQRNVALLAAFKAVDSAFKAYRKRVIEEHGEEADYMYRNGLHAEQITEIETDENGKSKKVKKTIYTKDANAAVMYSQVFNKDCDQYSEDYEYNKLFLYQTQLHFNDMLIARGHVFLNEVYDALGIEREDAALYTGWTTDGPGDHCIDFGCFAPNRDILPHALLNGKKTDILLNFNVDGVIVDVLKKAKRKA